MSPRDAVFPAGQPEQIAGWVPYWVDEEQVVDEAVRAGFTDILMFHGTVKDNGQVKLENPEGLARGLRVAGSGKVVTWLTVTNHGRSLSGALAPGRLEMHVASLLDRFGQSGCDHLDLDYESLTPDQARQLPRLAGLLDRDLPPGVKLSFTLQPVCSLLRRDQVAMVRELLAMPRVHNIRFMMYDYAWRHSLPGALCPLSAYRRLLETWEGYGPRLTVCLPLYGYDWPRPEDVSLPRADTVFLRDVPGLPADFFWVRQDAELAALYVKDGVQRMVAVPSHRAIKVRVAMALAHGVPSVAFWHLGAARLAPVVTATRRDGGGVAEEVDYGEIGSWDEWLQPYKQRVCRVIIGGDDSLAEIAARYGVPPGKMNRFNRHITGSPRNRTVYLPLSGNAGR